MATATPSADREARRTITTKFSCKPEDFSGIPHDSRISFLNQGNRKRSRVATPDRPVKRQKTSKCEYLSITDDITPLPLEYDLKHPSMEFEVQCTSEALESVVSQSERVHTLKLAADHTAEKDAIARDAATKRAALEDRIAQLQAELEAANKSAEEADDRTREARMESVRLANASWAQVTRQRIDTTSTATQTADVDAHADEDLKMDLVSKAEQDLQVKLDQALEEVKKRDSQIESLQNDCEESKKNLRNSEAEAEIARNEAADREAGLEERCDSIQKKSDAASRKLQKDLGDSEAANAKLQAELSQLKARLGIEALEASERRSYDLDTEMADSEPTAKHLSPKSISPIEFSSSTATAPVTPSTSTSTSLGSSISSSSTSMPTHPSSEAVKSSVKPAGDFLLDDNEVKPARAQVEKIASKAKATLKIPGQQTESNVLAKRDGGIRKPEAVRAKQTKRSETDKARLEAMIVNGQVPTRKSVVSAAKSQGPQLSEYRDGPVQQVRKPRSTRQAREEAREQHRKEDEAADEESDIAYVEAKNAYESGDTEILVSLKGQVVQPGDLSASLYFSNHSNTEDIIMAELGRREDVLSTRNECLPYDKVATSGYFAQQCFLVHIAELHIQVATKIFSRHSEDYRRFVDKFERERGLNKKFTEMTDPDSKFAWTRAVQKLSELPQFREACIAWAKDESCTGKWCWPPTFTDLQVVRQTSLNPALVEARMRDKAANDKLVEDFLIATNPNKENDDDISLDFDEKFRTGLNPKDDAVQDERKETWGSRGVEGMFGPSK